MSIQKQQSVPSIVGTLREHSQAIAKELGRLIESSTPDDDGCIHLNPILNALGSKCGIDCRMNNLKRSSDLIEKVAKYHKKAVADIYKPRGGGGGGTW